MKYYLFAGYEFCPDGGVHDFKKMSIDLEYLIKYVKTYEVNDVPYNNYDWYHIIDEDFNIVEEGRIL